MRRNTKSVKIGNIRMGSDAPIVIQSMLNTNSMDTKACVEQAMRIIWAGGDLIRITAQGIREAENLRNIRAGLTERGYTQPLSADIHFTPEAAMTAAKYVEKVRINPGNFIDKRATFEHITYTDEEYSAELQRLREKFTAFLNLCREHGTAVRIGTNHGSLSDRIMSRYGNTPAGMVEATMEYLRVCRDEAFDNVVISLKSSDCRVMVESVRLLVAQMEKEGMDYPLHLGVTEAGEGEDGRIRSALGIGTLLCEGIGDTIRVSLTEAPECEIPVALALTRLCYDADYRPNLPLHRNVCANPAIVSATTDTEYTYTRGRITNNATGEAIACSLAESFRLHPCGKAFVVVNTTDLDDALANAFRDQPDAVFIASGEGHRDLRDLLAFHAEHDLQNPIFIKLHLRGKKYIPMRAAAFAGGFFLDRAAAAIWIDAPDATPETLVQLSRDILQSAGCRRYKTEFVSCPGCGRTLFNLQATVKAVKIAFADYKNLKIAVMGCIVNGPGEMGDADFGYVGAGSGKVNLYKGGECVVRNIPEKKAIEALRQLIEENIHE